jgi:O-antigen/teichoic acid export membrane protein
MATSMSEPITGAERSRRVLRNVAGAVAARGASLFLAFYSTRLMLDLLGAESLGIWLVVLGMLQWVNYFDFGVGFGARNELSRNLARGDRAAAARTVTTGYLYCLYVAAALAATAVALMLTPLNAWLTATVFAGRDMGVVLLLCLLAFFGNLVLGFVKQVYAALEQGAAVSIYGLLLSLLLVLGLWALPDGTASIAVVAAVYCAAMILPNVLMSAWLFGRHPWLRPRAGHVDHGLRPAILSIGLQLFLTQLCALVMFATDRIIVSATVGAQAVVVYDAAFKVFSLLTTLHALLMGVLWSSFTHAHTTGDWPWIRRVLGRLLLLMIPLSAGAVGLAMASPWLVRWWLGDVAVGSMNLYWGFAAYVLLFCWTNTWANFLNGVGEIRVQMYSALVAAAVNVPLSVWLVRGMGLGEAGVIWGTVASLSLFSLIGPIETARVARRHS